MAATVDPLAARIIRIDSLDDPRVADYRHVREADLVGRRGVFIAEGEVVLGVLAAQRDYAVRSVLIGANRLDKLRPVLQATVGSAPIYVTDGALMDELVGFKIHRGVLAVGERTDPPDPERLLASLGSAATVVVALEALTNHDNVGGIFRNARAFGVGAVVLDRRCCDPLYRKAIRVSSGAVLRVPFGRFESTEQMIAGLRRAGFAVWALSPRRDAEELSVLLDDQPDAGRVALLLGTEGPGLSAAALRGADRVVRLDIEPAVDSLNVATTSGIALYELRKALGRSHPRELHRVEAE